MRKSTATFTWNGHEHTLLSETTAMACPGFSLPAMVACPGMVACGPEHICWGCYAQIGMYAQQSTINAQAARFAWTVHMIKNNPQGWIDTMVEAITDTGCTYFRPHDSGDLWSVEYANAWYEVAKRTPHVRYWFPTRSYHLLWIDAIRRLASLPNVVVRPSALEWNAPAPSVRGLQKGTTAVSAHKHMADGHTMCPKTMAGHDASCASVGCRDCWYKASGRKAYLQHGYFGRHTLSHATPAMQAARKEACRKAMDFVPVEALAGELEQPAPSGVGCLCHPRMRTTSTRKATQ